MQLTSIASSHTQQNLTDVNASDGAVGLAPRSPHAGLKPIRSGARQHLIDADDVERMSADTEMEAFLASGLDEIPGCMLARGIETVANVARHRRRTDEATAYLLAQMRAASNASELSCSYSLDTRWMHSGNSSTVARFRPRSKILILGSGTPRLNRDLG